jgi:predicted transcriptional regulator
MRRTGPAREIPPPLELECLKILWTLGRANVKDVREALASRRNLAYTTVMTVLDRLVHKGAVAREKSGRSFLYSPLLSREALRRVAVRELLDGFFDGSTQDLVAYLHELPAADPVPAPAPPPPATPPPASPAADIPDHRIDTVLL